MKCWLYLLAYDAYADVLRLLEKVGVDHGTDFGWQFHEPEAFDGLQQEYATAFEGAFGESELIAKSAG